MHFKICQQKKQEICFLIYILILIFANFTFCLGLEISNKINQDNINRAINQKEQKKPDIKDLENLLEDFFNEDSDNSELTNDHKEILGNIYFNENQILDKDINLDKKSVILNVNENENYKIFLEDYCKVETLKLNETISVLENDIYDLNNKYNTISEEKKKLEENLAFNENILIEKNVLIKKEIEEINNLKNLTTKKSDSQIIVLLNSLIHLVNSYYEERDQKQVFEKDIKMKKNFKENLIELSKKAISLKDYSLGLSFDQILSKEILADFSDSKIKKKILESLENIKKKFYEKDNTKIDDLQIQLDLNKKNLENNYNYLEEIKKEISNINNELLFIEKSQKNIQNTSFYFHEQLKKIKSINTELNLICN